MATPRGFACQPVFSSPQHPRPVWQRSCVPCVSLVTLRLHRKGALGPEVPEDLVQTTILLHQFVSSFRANTLYWFEVIATEQQAQFNKLENKQSEISTRRNICSRTCDIVISSPSRAFLRSTSRMGCFFASENVRWRKRMGVLNVSVSMSSDPAAYT